MQLVLLTMLIINVKKGLLLWKKTHTFFFLEGIYKVLLHYLLTLQVMQEGTCLNKRYSVVEMCGTVRKSKN